MKEIKFRVYDEKHNNYLNLKDNIYALGLLYDHVLYVTLDSVEDRVLKHTFEQWTGITDTNGVEIYQGDIVRQTLQDHDFMRDYPNGILLEVKLGIFEEDELVPQFYLTEYGEEDVEHERETFMDCYEYEVVGNIHQGVRE